MQILDVRDPNQVVSVSQIDADLGVANRRLLVLSGIALTDWKLDSDELHRGETQVRLGVYASNLEQWSAFVGLAHISNDETSFVFATDTARVELDPNTGELLLFVNTALLGEWSYLGRISYQVVVTVVRVAPHIAGTITWPKTLFTPPSRDVSTVAGSLTVLANRYERISPPGLFPYDKLTPVMPGQIVRLDISRTDFVAYYRIDNPPMAVDLQVTVNATGPAFQVPAPAAIAVGQVAGPHVFKLTGGAPFADGIDFAIGVLSIR
jgi:hypothetical protein